MLFFTGGVTLAQVGIGTTTPAATLDIPASNTATPASTDGILIPRLNAFPAVNPSAAQNGMMVFLANDLPSKPKGFYYWDNVSASWVGIVGSKGWDVLGNSGTDPATNFIGTTDDKDLLFKRNNLPSGQISDTNTTFGKSAMANNVNGQTNIAIGVSALVSQDFNNGGAPWESGQIAIGNRSLMNVNSEDGVNAVENVAVGHDALRENTIGSYNVAIGNLSLQSNIQGGANIAIGRSALFSNTSGAENIGIGVSALWSNTTGANNVALGHDSNGSNVDGHGNVAVGDETLYSNISGDSSVGIGNRALRWATGNLNTAIGHMAGEVLTSGSGNLALGYNAQLPSPTDDDQLSIANVIFGTTMSATGLGKIGIGEIAPSAKLQISAENPASPTNTDGIIIPRVLQLVPPGAMTAAQNGMMVFLTNLWSGNQPGFYYWNDATTSWQQVGGNQTGWLLSGNSDATLASFIGTTTPTDLFFRRNNINAGRISTYNTAFGTNSMTALTTGLYNVALGVNALQDNTTGLNNTAFGDGALRRNVSGGENCAFGSDALRDNLSGSDNIANGFFALSDNRNASKNIAFGRYAMQSMNFANGGTPYDTNNIAIGIEALRANNPTSTANGMRNIGIGSYALRQNTTGASNVAIGVETMNSNRAGWGMVAVGDGAMQNVYDSSSPFISNSVGIGLFALRGSLTPSNNTGISNTAVGASSMIANTSGSNNVSVGYLTMSGNTTGSDNVAVGNSVMNLNSGGSRNSAVGQGAMTGNTSGQENSAFGRQALTSNNGSFNVVVGADAMNSARAISNATALGYHAMFYANSTLTPTSSTSTAVGYESLRGSATPSSNTGSGNTAIGYRAMVAAASASSNTALGMNSLIANVSGSNNTAVGANCLTTNVTGIWNTAIGRNAFTLAAATAYTNSGAFGDGAQVSASNQIRIGDAAVTSIGGEVGWTTVSDARFKKDVTENVPGLSFITKLRPVTYHLDLENRSRFLKLTDEMRKRELESAKEKILQTGFIAQEVEAAAEASGFDFSGVDAPKNESDYYGLRYAEFVVPLVKAVQEQQTEIEKQRQEIEALKQILLEQSALMIEIQQQIKNPSGTR